MDPEFDELKREFLAEARQKAEQIESSLRNRERESLERSINLAHQLKGSGGSYGFEIISTEGAAIEAGLEKLLDAGSSEAERVVADHIQRLKEELSRRVAEFQPTSTGNV